MLIEDKTTTTSGATSGIDRVATECLIFERGTPGNVSFYMWSAESTVDGGWSSL